MARKQFVVHYPDRTRANISRSERDDQLLSSLIEPTEQPNQYRYIGKTYSCKNFADLSYIKEKLCKPVGETGCLPGEWIFQLGEDLRHEFEMRPGEMELRLRKQGTLSFLQLQT